jgi:hypothetical protein
MKRRFGWLPIIFALASIAMPAFFAVRHASTWRARIKYPGELDNAESPVLAEMVHLREGVRVYGPASTERYNSVLYGPLFYLLGSRLIDPQNPSHRYPRVVSLIATLGMAAACALLAYWISRSWIAAIIATVLFLAYPFVIHFGTQNRCDALALLLWFAGFLTAYRFRNSGKILFAVPLMTLGFFYKQQFIAAPLAILLFLMIEKRYRHAAQFVGLLGALGGGMLGLFQFVIFRHQSFLLHFFYYNAIQASFSQAMQWAVVLAVTFIVPVGVAVYYLRSHPDRLLACYFGILVPLLLVTMARRGANINYAIELLLLLCPLFAAQITATLARPSLALLTTFLLALTLWMGNAIPVWKPSTEDFERDRAVQTYLAEHFERHAPTLGLYAGDLERAGLDTPLTDLANYTWLVCAGRLPDQILLAPLEAQRYRLILLRFDLRAAQTNHDTAGTCFPAQFTQAILENYRPVDESAAKLFATKKYFAWIPRDGPGFVTAKSDGRLF